MGHLATGKSDQALQGILQDPALSDSSKDTYAQRLRAISVKLGQSISELAMQPMTVIPWIKKQYPEVATQKNVVTAVLAALRRMPAMKHQHRRALAIWLRASKELEAQQQARLKANEPSVRQQRGYVDFREVIKVRTRLAKIPMNLTQELWTSLQAEPARRWLFTTNSGSPYTAKNFSKWCCAVLHKLFARPLTLTSLRHSYLNSMDWNKLTIAARENLASDMCHSTETQDTYRWISGKHHTVQKQR
ncbi:TPA: hypothetical protein ACH3X1_006195 [Trebouxia sp. C0004]